jgi:PAS domain S-box-containing protein
MSEKSQDRIGRQVAQRMLRLMRDAVENSEKPVFWLTSDGRVEYANLAACESLGYSRAELSKLRMADFSSWQASGQWEDSLWPLIKESGVLTFEAVFIRKDGTAFPAEILANHIRIEGEEYVLGFATDISERQRVAKALETSEKRFRALFDSAPVGIVLTTKQGRALTCNSAFCEIMGLTQEELLQLPAQAYYADPDERRKMLAQLSETGAIEGLEIHGLRGDGSPYWFSLTAVNLPEVGPDVLLATFMDITEHKEAAGRLERNAQEVVEANEALQRKNVALQELMATIQGQRTQLGNIILSNTERVIYPMLQGLRGVVEPDQQLAVDQIQKSLEEIVSPFIEKGAREFRQLTATELRICKYIQRGLGSKEIASLEHVAVATVKKHRERIRRKLGISGKSVNLATHLYEHLSSGDAE